MEKGYGGKVDGRVVSSNAFKARLMALESFRMIWMIKVSSEIRTRSEGVFRAVLRDVRFWAVFRAANRPGC